MKRSDRLYRWSILSVSLYTFLEKQLRQKHCIRAVYKKAYMLKAGFGKDPLLLSLTSNKRCTAGIRDNAFQLWAWMGYKLLTSLASQTASLIYFYILTSVKKLSKGAEAMEAWSRAVALGWAQRSSIPVTRFHTISLFSPVCAQASATESL